MRVVGFIFLALGVMGIAAGVFGMMQVGSLSETIDQNTKELGEMFPGMEEATSDDVVTLVEMDIALNDLLLTAYGPERDAMEKAQGLVRGKLDAMGDIEDFQVMQTAGFAGGGGFFAIGLLLVVLGGRKKSGAEVAA